jgi:arylsulfatase A-like enzyme
MVSTVDRVVGDLRAVVDAERTLFLFLADNGTPEVLNGARKGRAKGTCHDRGSSVPLIAVGPGIARGGVSAELIGTVDLYATLAEWLGLERDAAREGEDSLSFAAALRAPAEWRSPRGWIFAEVYAEDRDDVMVRDARFKLRILNGKEMFMDLKSDPAERNPRVLPDEALGPEENAALTRLRELLAKLPPRAS